VTRERFFTPRIRVRSYEELNGWLLDQCIAYAKSHPRRKRRASAAPSGQLYQIVPSRRRLGLQIISPRETRGGLHGYRKEKTAALVATAR
jgi:hypothetical protein